MLRDFANGTLAESPEAVAWIDANEAVLSLVTEASKRPRFWMPVTESGTLLNAPIPRVIEIGWALDGLAARARIAIESSEWERADEDLRTIARVASAFGRDDSVHSAWAWTPLTHTLPAVAASPFSSSAKAKELLGFLKELDPPRLIENDLLRSRFYQLTQVTLSNLAAVRFGPEILERGHGAEATYPLPTAFFSMSLSAVDWDEALRLINRYNDLDVAIVSATTMEERAARVAELDEEFSWTQLSLDEILGDDDAAALLRRAETDPEARERVTRGYVVGTGVLPSAARTFERQQVELGARFHVALTSLALAVHRAEHGGYPGDADVSGIGFQYAYDYVPGPSAQNFALVARPGAGGAGVRSFCVDSGGASVAGDDPDSPLNDGARCVSE